MTESISGLSSMVLAIPVGLLVDRYPQQRAKLLKLSVIFAVVTSVLATIACLTDIVLLLYVALLFLGTFAELSSSTSEALFADSVPQGHRSGVFITKSILTTVGSACGPLLSAVGLLFLGDKWEPHQMKAVVIFGCVLMPLSCIPCLFFQDPPAAAAEAEDAAEGAEAQGLSSSSPGGALRARRCGPFQASHVPFLLAFADFVTCIGAGMTVKFFNLFFIQDKGFSPTDICWLQTAYPLVIAVFMKLTQGLSKPFGRAQASCSFFSANVVCLVLLSQVQPTWLLLVVFLLRGGFANSTSPIDRSILMDFTPSSQRGRWNAVQSFTSMTWSGSAFFGGLLADSHDYRFTFLITALVYGIACVAYSPLLFLVPRREAEAAGVAGDGGVESCEHRSAREVPLMERAAAAQASTVSA